VIRGIYYDKDDGFDSVVNTYRKANQVLDTITVADVKAFIEKQKGYHKQVKPYRGFNSYVAPRALRELQIDLAVFIDSAKDNDGFKFDFVAIDTFSKYIWAVPIKDKKAPESIRAFTEALNEIAIPQQIMSDREGAWESTEFVKFLNKHEIKHIISTSPPPFSERAVQEI
jgi:transposase InsO family protein